MTGRDPRSYLADAIAAIDDIEFYTLGFDQDRFRDVMVTQHAVERQLITLGEALGAFRKLDPERAGRLTNLHDIIATRHRLVHAYELVSVKIIWTIVKDFLPALKQELGGLLAEIGQ